MAYEKELPYRDYIIAFEYELDDDHNGLLLTNWTAYIGKNEVEIPCEVESKFIEDRINAWLETEFLNNAGNYEEDYLGYRADRAYDMMKDMEE